MEGVMEPLSLNSVLGHERPMLPSPQTFVLIGGSLKGKSIISLVVRSKEREFARELPSRHYVIHSLESNT